MTHICVNKITIIGSNNGLSPGRRQVIIWTNGRIVIIGPLGTNFSEILIEILTLSFKKMRLKVSSGKWRPFCPGLIVLICYRHGIGRSHHCTAVNFSRRVGCSTAETAVIFQSYRTVPDKNLATLNLFKNPLHLDVVARYLRRMGDKTNTDAAPPRLESFYPQWVVGIDLAQVLRILCLVHRWRTYFNIITPR